MKVVLLRWCLDDDDDDDDDDLMSSLLLLKRKNSSVVWTHTQNKQNPKQKTNNKP